MYSPDSAFTGRHPVVGAYPSGMNRARSNEQFDFVLCFSQHIFDYEKAGKIGLAIRTYEKNIEGDCYPACHSFDRLMVLYRKRKEYDKELAVIEKALNVLCKRYPDLEIKYEDRRRKVLDLIEKQNK